MNGSDPDLQTETLIYIPGNQSGISNPRDVYPLQLVVHVSNPLNSEITPRQQNTLSNTSSSSGLKKLSFLNGNYPPFPSDMSESARPAEFSIILDDDDNGPSVRPEMQSSNTKSKKLLCPKCSYQTMDKITLERHMRKHNSIFVCKVCKIHFPSVSSLIDHYNKRHLAGDEGNTEAHHFCPMCPFSSIEKLEYDKHITRHETAAYICQICGQPFAKQVSMKWHVKFKHDIITENDEQDGEVPVNSESIKVKIEADQMESISMEELQTELLDHGIEEEKQEIKPFAKRFNCLFCPKSFSTKLVLKYHSWRSHRERVQMSQILKSGELQESAPEQKSINKNWSPTKRVKSQSNNYQHQCPVCTFGTIYKSTLDRHIKKHGEAKFDCGICGMPFTVIGNLNRHKKVHHPDLMSPAIQLPKQHKCSLCAYSTSYKSTLERHLRTHGIAKYHCDLCDMPFVFMGSFVTHRALKHQLLDKDFQETVFTDKLTEDSKLSCNGKFLKRRKCPYCSVYMSSASKLNRHLRTHKNAGYYCVSCSVFFQQRSDFEHHMRDHLQLRNLKNRPNQDTDQSLDSRISQQIPAENSNADFEASNSLPAQDKNSYMTDELANFHVMGEASNLNSLPNSMVKLYDNQVSNNSTIVDKVVKIDLTDQQLSDGSLISRHALGSSPSETSRHFNETAGSALKIVSTCGSTDQHILGSSAMTVQRPVQNIYGTNPTMSEQPYPTVSQADSFHLENSNFFSSQTTDYNIDQQSFGTRVYVTNEPTFDMSQKDSFSVSRETPKQQQTLQQYMPQNSTDQNLCNETTNCNSQQQALNRDVERDLCACKILQPVHGEVLANPPFKGRYAKLVSDFDDFAMRPFACSLCFFRCSVLGDLYSHVQNHLTGCNMTPTPASAKFNTGPYLQGLAQQVDPVNQSRPSVPDIEYID